MYRIGDTFPQYTLQFSGPGTDNIGTLNSNDIKTKYAIYIFYPRDFTPVCNSELIVFNKFYNEFKEKNVSIFGVSIDSEYAHNAWRKQDKNINKLQFPLLADPTQKLTKELGILDEDNGLAHRALYITGNNHNIEFLMMTRLNIARNAKEALRIIDALNTGETCLAPHLTD